MVLSNKKLKQKLREALSQSAASSASNTSCSANPESLKQLLGEAIQKPVLSKREKRRISLPPQESASPGKNKSNGDTTVKQEEKPKLDSSGGATKETGEGKTKRKKTKKSKKGENGGGGDGGVEAAQSNGKAEEGEKKKLSDEKEKESGKKRKREAAQGNRKAEEEVEKKNLSDQKEKKNGKKRKRETDGGGEAAEEGKKKKLSDEEREKAKRKAKAKKKKRDKKKSKARKKIEKEKNQAGNVAAEVVTEGNEQQQDVDNGTSHQERVIVPNKVYVGGIPYYSTEDDIVSFFEQCGTISDMDCLTFPDTGKFRGIAILTFKTEQAAKRALALDGADMGGFFLKIEPYKKTLSATKPPLFCPPVIQGYHRIYVGNLSWDITEDCLKKLFSECSVSSIRFGEDKVTGDFKGYAHVDFSDDSSVEKALQLDQSVVLGRPVRISRAVAQRSVGSIGGTGVGGGGSSRSEPKVEETFGAENVDEQNVGDDGNAVAAESSVVASGKIKRRTCYECGERGHISSACPKKQTEQPK